jgi:hypothetical protein
MAATQHTDFHALWRQSLTLWGRVFLGLTVASIVCSLLAQSIDNSKEQDRNRRAQEDMTTLLKEVVRSTQTIEQPRAQLNLKVNCDSRKFSSICKKVLDAYGTKPEWYEIDVPKEYWDGFQEGPQYNAIFYHDEVNARRQNACHACLDEGDLQLFFDGAKDYQRHMEINFHYSAKGNSLYLELSGDSRVLVNSHKFMTYLDFEGATVVLYRVDKHSTVGDPPLVSEKEFIPEHIYVVSPRGQVLNLTDFKPAESGNSIVFFGKPFLRSNK